MLTDVLAYAWVWVILKLLRNFKEEKVKTQNNYWYWDEKGNLHWYGNNYFSYWRSRSNEKLFGSSSENEKLFGAGKVEAKSNCKKFSEKSRNNPPVENNFKNFQTNQSPPNK